MQKLTTLPITPLVTLLSLSLNFTIIANSPEEAESKNIIEVSNKNDAMPSVFGEGSLSTKASDYTHAALNKLSDLNSSNSQKTHSMQDSAEPPENPAKKPQQVKNKFAQIAQETTTWLPAVSLLGTGAISYALLKSTKNTVTSITKLQQELQELMMVRRANIIASNEAQKRVSGPRGISTLFWLLLAKVGLDYRKTTLKGTWNYITSADFLNYAEDQLGRIYNLIKGFRLISNSLMGEISVDHISNLQGTRHFVDHNMSPFQGGRHFARRPERDVLVRFPRPDYYDDVLGGVGRPYRASSPPPLHTAPAPLQPSPRVLPPEVQPPTPPQVSGES